MQPIQQFVEARVVDRTREKLLQPVLGHVKQRGSILQRDVLLQIQLPIGDRLLQQQYYPLLKKDFTKLQFFIGNPAFRAGYVVSFLEYIVDFVAFDIATCPVLPR